MALTEKQKQLLRIIAPGLEKGLIGDDWIFVDGDEGFAGIFQSSLSEPKENADRIWEEQWITKVTPADLQVFVAENYFVKNDKKAYSLKVQNILDAVRRNFADISSPALASTSVWPSLIVISYGRDLEEVRPMCIPLARRLSRTFPKVWYDHNLIGGQNWWSEILANIAKCDLFIPLLSDDYIGSEWCRKELDEAISRGKHLLPICLMPVEINGLPSQLTEHQIIRIWEKTLDIETLNEVYAAVFNLIYRNHSLSERLSDQAREWARKLVNFKSLGSLKQNFHLVNVTAGTAQDLEFIWGLGADGVPELPPSLGTLQELDDVGLIQMFEEPKISSTGRVTINYRVMLRKKLDDAVHDGL